MVKHLAGRLGSAMAEAVPGPESIDQAIAGKGQSSRWSRWQHRRERIGTAPGTARGGEEGGIVATGGHGD
jgi:hypothetical protein